MSMVTISQKSLEIAIEAIEDKINERRHDEKMLYWVAPTPTMDECVATLDELKRALSAADTPAVNLKFQHDTD